MPKPLIVEELYKSYGNVRALDGLTFTVDKGSIYGLLGPNGAGKTTTLNIISGILDRDGGKVQVYGFDPSIDGRKVKSLIGYVPE
ncbi:MAG TPA: ATP-binding cassette domain-containing protein, partial [Candidatus Bathyarchaeota archaeon]|nr:ATP-binding cassette domain-containing protein [Candidatus Bathyarchaeota archaeon]